MTRTMTDLAKEAQARLDETPVSDTLLLLITVNQRDTMTYAASLIDGQRP